MELPHQPHRAAWTRTGSILSRSPHADQREQHCLRCCGPSRMWRKRKVFRAPPAVARQQKAKSWELKASTLYLKAKALLDVLHA
jgi:hypothetical protein